MKNKIVGIFISMLMLLTILSSISLGKENENYSNDILNLINTDVLDQYQLNTSHTLSVLDFTESEAQSFIPTMSVTSKIELYLSRQGVPNNLFVGIKNDINGEIIVSTFKTPDEIPISPSWVEFDIPDVYTPVGKPSYIYVTETDGVHPGGNVFSVYGSKYNKYMDGWRFYSSDEGKTWEEFFYHDLAFKTYVSGMMDEPPIKPSINGPTSGEISVEYEYILNALDPDGNDVKYLIDWGDGTPFEITGFNPSDLDVVVKHKWCSYGRYYINVTARDIYEAESEQNTFIVSIPKSKIKTSSLYLELINLLKNDLGNIKTGFIIGPYESKTWDEDFLVLNAGFQNSPAKSLNFLVPLRRGHLHQDEQINLVKFNNCILLKNYIIGFCKIYMPHAEISMHIQSQIDSENEITWVVDEINGDKIWERNIHAVLYDESGKNHGFTIGPLLKEYISSGDQISINTHIDGYFRFQIIERISQDILFESPLVKY